MPYTTWTPGLLQHAGLVDVVFLVEPGLQLDQGRHLLAVFGARASAVMIGLASAVRYSVSLMASDLRILRRLLDELDDRAERLVGMMDEDVVVADGREDVVPLGQCAPASGARREAPSDRGSPRACTGPASAVRSTGPGTL